MILSDPPAKILVAHLITLGTVDDPEGMTNIEWPGYYSTAPDSIDNAVMLFDEKGTKDGRSMRGEVYTHPGVQLMVRSLDYDLGWEKGCAILNVFDAVLRTTIIVGGNEYRVDNIVRDGDLIPLTGESRFSDLSKERRWELFSCHFRMAVVELVA